MPPLQKKKKLQTTFQNATSSQNLRSSLFLSQQTDLKGHLTDTLLICPEGKIRAHAFILQSASPVFQNCLTSQGEDYYYTREILLPDFPLQEIEQVMNLLYKGFVHLPDNISMSKFKQTLEFFQISGVDLSVNTTTKTADCDGPLKLGGSLRVNLSCKSEAPRLNSSIMILDTDEDNCAPPPDTPPPKLEPQIFASPQQYPQGTRQGPSLKRGGSASNFRRPSKMPRLMFNLPTVTTKPEVATDLATPTPSSEGAPKPVVDGGGGGDLSKKVEPVGLCSEDEDGDWEVPNYKNAKWLRRESRRCQSCDEDFETIAEAQTCAKSHDKPLRCYLCFKVFSLTEKLFSHYKRRHKPALGREDNLICPFCDNAVPNKNVSVHVISVHLSNGVVKSGGAGGVGVGRVGRQPTITSVPQAQGQRSREVGFVKEIEKPREKKKGAQVKLPNMMAKWRRNRVGAGEEVGEGMLKVPDLNLKIEMELGTGRKEIWLRKERDQQDSNFNENK